MRASTLPPSTLGAPSERNAALSWVATSLRGGATATRTPVAKAQAAATGHRNLDTNLAILASILSFIFLTDGRSTLPKHGTSRFRPVSWR
jgi:hypothetical protein